MATLDSSATSTTNLKDTIEDFSVSPESLDYASAEGETYWTFDDAKKNIGYLKTIPEWYSALKILAIWTAGIGYETNADAKIDLEHVTGNGKDTFLSILENMIIFKKAIGDSFAEIVREKDRLINLKPISPERVRLVFDSNGMLKRYDIMQPNGEYKPLKKENMFHLVNDKMADELHGHDLTKNVQWVIDARQEALRDERMIRHRELSMGVLYLANDNPAKRDVIKTQYAEAVKNGEVLVLPEGTAKLQDSGITPRDRLAYIQYLENFFYQATGVPRVMATSEGFTEAGGKVGFLTFQPVYTNEQQLLEQDMWNQLGIKIKFNRPPSLTGVEQENEAKNTGQLGFQPKDTKATMTKE